MGVILWSCLQQIKILMFLLVFSIHILYKITLKHRLQFFTIIALSLANTNHSTTSLCKISAKVNLIFYGRKANLMFICLNKYWKTKSILENSNCNA